MACLHAGARALRAGGYDATAGKFTQQRGISAEGGLKKGD